jgi:hypothetical protein
VPGDRLVTRLSGGATTFGIPDGPILDRSASSMIVLAARVRSCFDAYRVKDEPALRIELDYLEAEVRMLKAQPAIIPGRRPGGCGSPASATRRCGRDRADLGCAV